MRMWALVIGILFVSVYALRRHFGTAPSILAPVADTAIIPLGASTATSAKGANAAGKAGEPGASPTVTETKSDDSVAATKINSYFICAVDQQWFEKGFYPDNPGCGDFLFVNGVYFRISDMFMSQGENSIITCSNGKKFELVGEPCHELFMEKVGISWEKKVHQLKQNSSAIPGTAPAYFETLEDFLNGVATKLQ